MEAGRDKGRHQGAVSGLPGLYLLDFFRAELGNIEDLLGLLQADPGGRRRRCRLRSRASTCARCRLAGCLERRLWLIPLAAAASSPQRSPASELTCEFLPQGPGEGPPHHLRPHHDDLRQVLGLRGRGARTAVTARAAAPVPGRGKGQSPARAPSAGRRGPALTMACCVSGGGRKRSPRRPARKHARLARAWRAPTIRDRKERLLRPGSGQARGRPLAAGGGEAAQRRIARGTTGSGIPCKAAAAFLAWQTAVRISRSSRSPPSTAPPPPHPFATHRLGRCSLGD